MKAKLCLFLCVPAILLTSCGSSAKKVSFVEFKEKATEAINKGNGVKIVAADIELKGSYAGEDAKVHEVWTTKNNELVIDYVQTTYEGNSEAIYAAKTFCRMAFNVSVSDYIAEDGGAQYQYGIDPLTVYYTYIAEDENTYGRSNTYEVSFDEYGNLVKGSFEEKYAGIAEKGKLEVKFTYENK